MNGYPGLDRALVGILRTGAGDAARLIGEACVEFLPIDRAALTMMTRAGNQQPIWASDAVANELDELQFSLGQGPCIEAFTEHRPVLVPDLLDVSDSRWPIFAAEAARTPVRAIHVFPLQIGAIAIGVLDLYRDQAGILEQAALAGALRAADAAFVSLLDAQYRSPDRAHGVDSDPSLFPERDVEGAGLISPLRHVAIYQATGMVMAQMDSTIETALATLRAYAYAHDIVLAEVARDVIERRLRFDQETP